MKSEDGNISPTQGDTAEISLADVFDVPAIQRLMDDFYKLTNFATAMLDIKGNVLVATGWQDICTKFHRVCSETAKHCTESDTLLADGVEPGTFKTYRCKNNMLDVVTPITIEGRHVGNLFLGQFFYHDDPVDHEYFRSQARKYGFDEKEYIAAYDRVPRWSRETVETVMSFFMQLSKMVIDLNYSNINLNRKTEEVQKKNQELEALNQQLAASEEEIRAAGEELQEVNEKLEQRVQQRTAQLEASNKELEAFTYSVSHDLRVPLRAIDGFTKIVSEDYNDKLDDEGLRLMKVIRDNTLKMSRLIDDLLTYSRMGQREMVSGPVDMFALAHSVFEEVLQANPGRKVSVTIGDLPPAEGDRTMLRQALINLVANSFKFTRSRPDATVEIGSAEQGGKVWYFVKDNGVGFDMKYAGKLFGVFQRLHSQEEFEGTGVGLAIVQRVINKHGGAIRGEGQVGHGAAFYFCLSK